jgi:predicted adenylyl cyclase CyaB
MSRINVEIKARCGDHARIRPLLRGARFAGTDHQVDTYFRCGNGRLKLREGNIENYLIHYAREDRHGPKQSDVTLFAAGPDSPLKRLLTEALGILAVVDKSREIYFFDNVKIHLDTVRGLGTFLEIEAIDEDGAIGREKLTAQCRHYMDLFGVREQDLLATSYSDMLLER